MLARGTLTRLLVPLAILAVLLGACADDSASEATDPVPADSSTTAATDSAEPSDTAAPSDTAPPTPDWPACSDVWVAGAKIPLGYKGCLEGDDPVKADNLPCSSGQRIVRYDDRFFGVGGGKVYQASAPLDKDKQYLKMVRVCRA